MRRWRRLPADCSLRFVQSVALDALDSTRLAANAICLFGTSSVYYDHALDLVTGLTEGATPSRGGDPTTMFPLRMVSYGFDAENAR